MTKARWIGKALLLWKRAHTSLWFVPALLVAAAVVLSTVLLQTDHALEGDYAGSWWLFGGSASGARTVLSVIAGSLITVVAVAFSVTMIALQQASTQFSPRVLRNFMRDRGNQIVLGTYIATFTYSLLVLRRVRESVDGGAVFVPSIAISTGMLLALVSLALLVYFIHHVSEALQVTSLLSSVRRELDAEIERMFPAEVGGPAEEPSSFEAMVANAAAESAGLDEITVRSDEEGYVRRIDHRELAAAAEHCARVISVEIHIGEYVRSGDVVARAWVEAPADDAFGERIRGAFQVDRDRSLDQDPLYGFQQLVDIGVKALSPGINDPTTAEQALDRIGGALGLLLQGTPPSPVRELDGVRLLFRTPAFADYVEASFAQIRRAARGDLHVTLYLLGILRKLVEQTTSVERATVLRRQMGEVVAGLDQDALTQSERELLQRPIELLDTQPSVSLHH